MSPKRQNIDTSDGHVAASDTKVLPAVLDLFQQHFVDDELQSVSNTIKANEA